MLISDLHIHSRFSRATSKEGCLLYTSLLEGWEKDAKFTVNKKEWKKAELTDYDKYTIKQPETEETEGAEGTAE